MAPEKVCGVAGCGNRFHGNGFCAVHNYHFKAHGDPLGGKRGSSPGASAKWLEDHVHHQSEECLEWPFEVSRWGYGTIKVDGIKRVASRVMCEMAHGPAPIDRLDAAHSCNNRKCCNPRHLRWATRSENNLDMHEAGTAMRGEKVVFAKLTEADVLKIRGLAGAATHKEIATEFGVNASAISRIMSGKRWGWLTDGNVHRTGPSLCRQGEGET